MIVFDKFFSNFFTQILGIAPTKNAQKAFDLFLEIFKKTNSDQTFEKNIPFANQLNNIVKKLPTEWKGWTPKYAVKSFEFK